MHSCTMHMSWPIIWRMPFLSSIRMLLAKRKRAFLIKWNQVTDQIHFGRLTFIEKSAKVDENSRTCSIKTIFFLRLVFHLQRCRKKRIWRTKYSLCCMVCVAPRNHPQHHVIYPHTKESVQIEKGSLFYLYTFILFVNCLIDKLIFLPWADIFHAKIRPFTS